MEAKMIQLYADNEMTIPASPVVSEQTVFDDSGEASIPKIKAILSNMPTDEHINGLIDAKLGVIENGTY